MSLRLHIVLSAPSMFGFMTGQPARFHAIGCSVTIASAPSSWLDQRAAAEGAARVALPMRRDISLLHDAQAFARLCVLFHRDSPGAVILSGPKAIFLGGMAAWLCGVPRRVAVYHGMRQENLRGPLRWVLDLCDRVSFACAGHVLAVSPSLRDLMLSRGLVAAGKVSVIGHGTANGVDPRRFALSSDGIAAAVSAKHSLGIPRESPVIGFVGRLTEDKGIDDAYAAYKIVRQRYPGLYLLLVGCEEMRTAAGRDLVARLRADGQVRFVEHTDAVEIYMHILWAQVFASSREGFGMVIAEAAAMAVPTVAYDVTGVRDAIVGAKTGTLVPRGDVTALAAALESYLSKPEHRRRHGLAGWHHVRRHYAPEFVWSAYPEALGLSAVPTCAAPDFEMGAQESAAFGERERLLR